MTSDNKVKTITAIEIAGDTRAEPGWTCIRITDTTVHHVLVRFVHGIAIDRTGRKEALGL